MFSDHDNPLTAAAAAPAHESQSQSVPQEKPQAASQDNPAEQQPKAVPEQNAAHETPSQRTEEDPKTETVSGTPAPAQPVATEVHGDLRAGAEANAAQSASDAEATAAAEEAASTEEMSKLLDQYDEQHESPANTEIIEVKVIAHPHHGA